MYSSCHIESVITYISLIGNVFNRVLLHSAIKSSKRLYQLYKQRHYMLRVFTCFPRLHQPLTPVWSMSLVLFHSSSWTGFPMAFGKWGDLRLLLQKRFKEIILFVITYRRVPP
jgi:hypothetical protein